MVDILLRKLIFLSISFHVIYSFSILNMKILLIIIIISLTESRSPDHVYRIKEELPIHHTIGYLNNDIPKFQNGDSVNYKILNTKEKGVHCFLLEEKSSKLIIASRIDRESLCSASSLLCYITIKVALHGTDNLIHIRIEIEDINDHSPLWHIPKFKVSFNDGDNAGSRKSLPSAKDLDVGENGEIKYTLEGTTNTFLLVQEHGLYLQTLKQLDREVKENYEINILAVDRGSVARSTRLKVEVEIIDVNDNNPRFSTSVFRPSKVVPETIPIGSIILTLSATDLDAGQNGEFSFYFSPTETSLAKSYFFLKSNGEIIVQRQLDYDSGYQKFEFKVIVKDHASSGYERSSESRVEIIISDENDEYPTITVYPVNINLETGFLKVNENKSPMTSVALVHAIDKDFKETDAVTCSSKSFDKSESLKLLPTNENNEYKLVTSRTFDRELEKLVFVSIHCVDTANHKKVLNLTIEVNDVNDNIPKFAENIFHLYIKENMEPGTVVRNRVSATDQDDSDNGLISYSILSNDQIPFSIELRSAIIRTKERLDRERKNQYHFLVVASDNGKPPLSSSASVIIYVEDENDNPVIIDPYPNEFKINENLPPNTFVGKLLAKDNDNQTIIYFLDHDSEAVRFKIDRITGSIVTKTQLDRETIPKYQFRVFATDKQNTASILITILVGDENDNSPKFKMPNNTFNSVVVSPLEAAGFNLAKIQAEDADEKENSLIQYYITNNKLHSLFSIDKDTGVLYLESTLHNYRPEDRDFFSLDLEACDMGKSRKCTSFKGFKVYLQKSHGTQDTKDQPNLLLDSSGFSENIVVGLIAFLLMMILVTIIVIILLRRRTRNNSKHRKAISNPTPYIQNQSGKSPLEFDQCSVEICELTSRLSPERDQNAPQNQLTYYNIGDQYQGGHIIPMNVDQPYQVPFITTYQQQMLNPRTIQKITDNMGYYSKYDMNDNPKFSDESQIQLINNERKHSTPVLNNASALSTPLQTTKKITSNTIRKPQTSFV